MDMVMGAFTGYTWNQIEPWVKSLEKTGFVGHKAVIVYNVDFDTCAKLKDHGFVVMGPGDYDFPNKKFTYTDPKFSIWNDRFWHCHRFLYDFIQKNDVGRVCMTDVRDVIFQLNPFDYVTREMDFRFDNFILSSEDIAYQNEPWGKGNLSDSFPHLYEFMKDRQIYNVGVLFGGAEIMCQLFLAIFQYTRAALDGSKKHISDQAAYNVIVRYTPFADHGRYTNHDEIIFAAQLGTVGDPTKFEQFKPHLLNKHALVLNDEGVVIQAETEKVYPIVHQYDRMPEWRSIILDRVLS